MALDNLIFPNKTVVPRGDRIRLTVEAILLVVVCFVTAVFVPNVSLVFGLTGSTGSTLSCYILPPWFYIKLVKPPTRKRVGAWIVFIFGMGFGLLATSVALAEAIRNKFD